jgi:cell division GTPase FtsZ
MRIVAIGLGGAGCRIVDSLYATDRHSSKVACVQGLAIDVDETTLHQLEGMPDSAKIFFPPFDPENPDSSEGAGPTATIDIAEIVSRINNFESGETDAIVVCCGLGGSMADIVPHVVAGLRASIVEPIFGLVTLPCLAEGKKRSAKAADDIDILSPLLDGMILFDNETWYKKIKAGNAKLVKKEKGLAQMLGFGRDEPKISPELATYLLLNEAIVRRISLILRAGEFRADGGIDLAEVVLDSGEVLNTMKDGGFITIGYAVERLPSNPLAFLSQLKPAGVFNEESKKKASRIVDLAKQAIYHEVSTPCDMTSAHKALVLIAGPSHELSMQGFMTVRKWIDRSIKGLEMRSGDYPVVNTKNVAIIVMLSGLENIPRVSELKEIREQARLGPSRGTVSGADDKTMPRLQQGTGSLRDEMITLPTKMQKGTRSDRYSSEDAPRHAKVPVNEKDESAGPPVLRYNPQLREPAPAPETNTGHLPKEEIPVKRTYATEEVLPETSVSPGIQPHRRIVSHDREIKAENQPAQQPISHEPAPTISTPPGSAMGVHSNEIARKRIEQELQRQRMMALSGSRVRTDAAIVKPKGGSSEIIRQKREITHPGPPPLPVSRPPQPEQEIQQVPVKKTVIIRKRTHAPDVPETRPPNTRDDVPPPVEDTKTGDPFSFQYLQVPEPEEGTVEVKDPSFRARDGIFSGKNIRGASVPKVQDASLLHTNLKPKKSAENADSDDAQDKTTDREGGSSPARSQGKKTKKQDDISWI